VEAPQGMNDERRQLQLFLAGPAPFDMVEGPSRGRTGRPSRGEIK
jgi:hypothetical protein